MAALDDGWRLHDEHEAGQHAKPVDGCGRCFRGLVAERDLARDASRTNMETMREMEVRLGRAEAERDALKAEVKRLQGEVDDLTATRTAWANDGAALAAALRSIMMESGEPVSAEKAEKALREFEGGEV